jgi:ATP-dependent DNA ligase
MPGKQAWNDSEIAQQKQPVASVASTFRAAAAQSALVYAGKVDHGFDGNSAKELQARLKPLVRKTQPYAKKIAHPATWVEPPLLAEIEYRAKSAEGELRHPLFKAIREDLG